jgi:hypothetical protein
MRKPVCSKCKGPIEPSRAGKYAYCMDCHAEWMRNNRPSHSEMTPEARMKHIARSNASEYVRRGKISKQPCEVCGDPVAEKHHDDYGKKLDVRWLCRKHHMEWHINQEIFKGVGEVTANAKDLLTSIMKKWSEHLYEVKTEHPNYEPTFYSFAYWLIMWSEQAAQQKQQKAA